MKQIVPSIVALLAISAGGGTAYFLKLSGSSSPKPASAAHDAGGDEGEGHANPKTEKKEKKGHGSSDKHGDADAVDVTYYKFSREFVVPMIEDDRVQSLVILNLNLEVDTAISQELFSKEPVLRDNIMTTLVKLSSGGRTLNSITDVDNYETLRAMILTNLQNEIPEGIRNVLILDMARQDL
ncbi:flagellar basal body-associated FliL family protein [Hyphomonas sp.]|uniref:flagellar basal body-associated FliL family protein n=1 Tax=Hyphomonas sp. TaxID=87 RepID=UPI0030017785|eukprot:TRINITY_DN35525_c0_g1_i1.p3 TRINITY_DN35525_c0_g1~~TRINITY_DN35525_c0_g1_i1.p3  ORF type:complete len:182 (+),score=44.96 TRINITY_DN35525_c0_g1_i1:25-570(+)